jgi:F-type H+-transporting ATPase subunit gamma
MATDQELRRQIETVSDLSGIVRTMKALAAVNGRQFERALQSLGEYEHTVERGLQVALRGKPL